MAKKQANGLELEDITLDNLDPASSFGEKDESQEETPEEVATREAAEKAADIAGEEGDGEEEEKNKGDANDSEETTEEKAAREALEASETEDEKATRLAKEAEDAEPEPLVQSLRNKIGGLEDLEGEFDDTEEGLVQFTTAAAGKMAETQLTDLFTNLPQVGQFMEYMLNGGDERKYFDTISRGAVEDIKVDQKNVLLQKQLLENKLNADGMTSDEIDDTIEDYEKAGILFNEAVRAQKILGTRSKSEKALMLEAQARDKQRNEQTRQENIRQISSIVRKGVVSGLQIPETKKQAFLDFLYAPIDSKGTTKSDQARQQLDPEKGIALEYLLFTGVDLSKVVTAAASSKKVQGLRDRLAKKDKSPNPADAFKSGTGAGRGNKVYVPSIEEIM